MGAAGAVYAQQDAAGGRVEIPGGLFRIGKADAHGRQGARCAAAVVIQVFGVDQFGAGDGRFFY